MSSVNCSDTIRACRICLDAKCAHRVSFEVPSEWSQKFEYCFGLSVMSSNAPRVFCNTCADKLQEYVTFKERCLRSDTLWNTMLSCMEVKYEKDEVKFLLPSEVIKTEEMDDDEYLPDNSYSDPDYSPFDIYPKANDKVVKKESKRKPKNTQNARSVKVIDLTINKDRKLKAKKIKKEKLKLKKLVSNKKFREKLMKGRYFEEIQQTGKIQPKQMWQCNKCEKEYKKKTYLLEHLKTCYEDLKNLVVERSAAVPKPLPPLPSIFSCGICDYSSPDWGSWKHHFSEHCSNNDLLCKLCDYLGKDVADMVSHRFVHVTPLEDSKFRCPTCSKVNKRATCLQYHYRKVHLMKKGGLCSICEKPFSNYKCWQKHEKLHRYHKFMCDVCNRKFLTRCDIKSHMRIHTDKKNIICELCGKGFNKKSNFQSHMKAMHSLNAPAKCFHCNRMYKNEFYLQAHLKALEAEKKYVCNICSKGFIQMGLLKSHLFWHSGEKPFSCEVCGSKYKAKSALKVHMRSHTGVKPYKCSECEKEFATTQLLKRHKMIHTGVRPHKCPYCDRSFYSKALMLAHCNSKHKMMDPVVDL